MLKMIFKDLRISPLRNILTSISMLVGIIAMIGSFLVGTLGKDYLISVNAQMYGWTPTYSYSITDSDFQDSISVKVSTGPAQRKKGAQKRPCKQTVLQGQSVFTQS